MKAVSLIIAIVATATVSPAWHAVLSAAELQAYKSATLEPYPSNDGDSFRVDLEQRTCVIRLYFVDCPETAASSQADARRVREPTPYFGLAGAKQTVDYGRKARQFTARALAHPFTVYTAFANAPGRSKGGRYYAFVQTHDGRDLGTQLVAQGLARNYGLGRGTPGGVSRREKKLRLGDLEVAAMMKRAGVWQASDPDRIVELRAAQRREEAELERIQEEAGGILENRLNVNHATRQELQLLKGIGPVLAKRIIEARPFDAVDQLTRVKGIGPATLKKLRGRIVVE